MSTTTPLDGSGDHGATTSSPLLVLDGLRKEFGARSPMGRRRGPLVAVDDVSLSMAPGETLGVVGESGSGKSTLASLVLRLIDPTSGRIEFGGRDITDVRGRDLRRLRPEMQAVFQDVSGSLNHKMNLGQIVGEPLRIHRDLSVAERTKRAGELLEMVGLSPRHLRRYPYELSGGQRQRIGVARALALHPRLLVMDEPVSALDVSTQSQVVNLLQRLQGELGTAYLFIAHDLYVVHHMSHRIAVMYLGAVVEHGSADQVYRRPRHPYTQALLSAIPDADRGRTGRRDRIVLSGEVPSPLHIPSGCRFHTRCPYAFDRCATDAPEVAVFSDGGTVACHLHDHGPKLDGRSVVELAIPKRRAAHLAAAADPQ